MHSYCVASIALMYLKVNVRLYTDIVGIAVEGLRGSAGGTGRVTLLTRGSIEEEVGSVV